MKRMWQFLTIQRLEGLKAFLPTKVAFTEQFRSRAPISKVLAWLRDIGQDEWEAWFLAQVPELTQAFLFHGADIHASKDIALYWASLDGRAEVVELLLEAGIAVPSDEDQILRCASRNGHLEVVNLLLRAGVRVHKENSESLYWALRNGHARVAELLRGTVVSQIPI